MEMKTKEELSLALEDRSMARLNPNYKDGRTVKFSAAQIKLGLELLNSVKTYREVEKMTAISESALLRAKLKASQSFI